jgi:hypothetical protein
MPTDSSVRWNRRLFFPSPDWKKAIRIRSASSNRFPDVVRHQENGFG